MLEAHLLPYPDDSYSSYPPSILIVSDNSGRSLKLNWQFEKYGYQLFQSDPCLASSIEFRQKYFDLIVLDVEQSDTAGLEMYQRLKDCSELRGIPIVMLTKSELMALATNALKKGLNYNLVSFLSDSPETDIATELHGLIEEMSYLTSRYS